MREEGRARLSDEAWELLSDRFDALVRAEREEAQAKGRGVLEALLPSGHGMPPKHFEGLLTGAVSEQLAAFEARAGALIPAGAPWAETLDENEGALALLRAALLREADVLRAAYAQRVRPPPHFRPARPRPLRARAARRGAERRGAPVAAGCSCWRQCCGATASGCRTTWWWCSTRRSPRCGRRSARRTASRLRRRWRRSRRG